MQKLLKTASKISSTPMVPVTRTGTVSAENAAKITEQVAKKVKKAANEIGRAGAMIGAGIAAALAVAPVVSR